MFTPSISEKKKCTKYFRREDKIIWQQINSNRKKAVFNLRLKLAARAC
jgi:hypothetical protein